ncbi:amidohydrolase family protein [Sphingobium subterraneum]|uniref:Putative TIM-barrel fold metal-dependent hydrolase n=1 Tax=Sphingobium subterraneum TaxID=627688 RepID=A0A841IVN8_9SPHN|nr:amidohydrolase family protein [Sphingobium subterraneum]MBB6122733.1 putative TIM-barrel fold metal-dependent hydrolase [Sphingobium subterraneum]
MTDSIVAEWETPIANAPDWTGRMIDLDSHEMIPMEMWSTYFGDAGQRYADLQMLALMAPGNSLKRPDLTGDMEPISYENVWVKKGPSAPSGIDLNRRVEVMDAMGIERQLVFPSFALVALLLASNPEAHRLLGFDPSGLDLRQLGSEGCDAHNRWAAAITESSEGRVRPVSIILPDDIDGMIRQAEEQIDYGVRAMLLSAGLPPANTSPADRALDPFWALLASHNIPLTFHLGSESALLASMAWSNAPEFNPSPKSSLEFQVEPYRTATLNFCYENYLTTMVLGGVFERHPGLVVGVVEATAHWVGPLAERLDIVASQFQERLAGTLRMEPSKYLARNVRVTPFPFEPIDRYLRVYPDMASVYCFATDFPHVEGGQESHKTYAAMLSAFDENIQRGFFRDNGMLLTPD